jgi:cardiolipin synthase
MIRPLPRKHVQDFTKEPLGPGWLRRQATEADPNEAPGPGVWRTGPEQKFRQELVRALDGAGEIVLLSSFLLADDKLADAILRAADRNVRVYLLTASEQRIGKVVGDDEDFEVKMAEQHKRLLERLAGKVLLRSAEHIHAKFVVVDPQLGAQARAWLSTANFNKALETSIELGVTLDGHSAQALAARFNRAFWTEAERELRGQRRLVEVRAGHPGTPAVDTSDTVFATLKDSTALRDRVIAFIQGARREILVASYGLAAEHPAVLALVDAARRGVRVTVLTRPRRAVAPALAALAAAGALVVGHDKLHAKALVVDGRAFVTSANLEAHGLDKGFEVAALLPASTSRVVEATLRHWCEWFPWAYRADATRGDLLGDFLPTEARLSDGILKVTALHRQDLPQVVAADAFALETAPMPKLVLAPLKNELPRKVEFVWNVEAPRLPKGAKERLQTIEREEKGKGGKVKKTTARVPFEPPVFDHDGRVLVLLKDAGRIDEAAQAARHHGGVVVLP